MSRAGVVVRDRPPVPFMPVDVSSGAKFVGKRVKREILPLAQESYSYSGSNVIEFSVGSERDFMIPTETALAFDLSVESTQNSVRDNSVELCDNGVHNLFNRIEVLDQSGRKIDEVEDYFRMSAIQNFLYQSKNHVHPNESMAGFSMTSTKLENLRVLQANKTIKTFTKFTAVPTNSTAMMDPPNTYVFTSTPLDFYIGQEVFLVQRDANRHPFLFGRAVVSQIALTAGQNNLQTTYGLTDENSIDLGTYGIRLVGAHVTAGEYDICVAINPAKEVVYQTQYAPVRLNMRLDLGFFKLMADFPLFLSGNLRIRFHLNNDRYVFKKPHGSTFADPSTRVLSYTIDNPRLITHFREPSADIAADYRKAYREQGGVQFWWPAYQRLVKQGTGEASTFQFDLPISKSSLNKVFMAITDKRAEIRTPGATAETDDLTVDTHTYKTAGLKEYQFQLGGVDYPNRRVQVFKDPSDKFNSEALLENQFALGLHDNLSSEMLLDVGEVMRAAPVKEGKLGELSGTVSDSSKMVFVTSFQTVINDLMSGVKTFGDNADPHVLVDLNFGQENSFIGATTNTNRYFWFFFEFARIFKLHSEASYIVD